MRYCCVPKCNGTGGFLFPKNPEVQKKWRIAIKRVNEKKAVWVPSKYSVVCELHFTESDFKEKNSAGFPHQRRFLKEGAVPSIFSFQSSAQACPTQRQLHGHPSP